MRHAMLALVVLSTLPSLALARPITAGVHLGLAQSELDRDAGFDAGRTLGLFGRLGFSERVAGQLELASVETDGGGVTVRTGTALIVVDLGSSGRLVPTLMAGIGLDRAEATWGGTTDAHHIEGGFGLEYRAEGGLTLGADVRLGGRTLHEPAYEAVEGDVPPDVTFYAAPTLREGAYRAARITLGIRF